jgi:hypothetical protein
MATTRRLAAILAADVTGYSRLMGVDEEGTFERLKLLQRELIDPKSDVRDRVHGLHFLSGLLSAAVVVRLRAIMLPPAPRGGYLL